MSDTLQNQISAFVDGELPEHEAELLVRRLCSSQQLRDVAVRYGLIGDVMRGEHRRSGLADRVMARVEQEPLTVGSGATGVSRYLRPVAGLAVAATVAGLALVSLQNFEPLPVETPPQVAMEQLAPGGSDGDNIESEQLSSTLRQRLNVYQVSHNLYQPKHRQWSGLTHLQNTSDEFTVADAMDNKDKKEDIKDKAE